MRAGQSCVLHATSYLLRPRLVRPTPLYPARGGLSCLYSSTPARDRKRVARPPAALRLASFCFFALQRHHLHSGVTMKSRHSLPRAVDCLPRLTNAWAGKIGLHAAGISHHVLCFSGSRQLGGSNVPSWRLRDIFDPLTRSILLLGTCHSNVLSV